MGLHDRLARNTEASNGAAEAGSELFFQPGQALLDSRTAGRAEDVGDEEDLHAAIYGKESAAAGWTETETWFPASGV